MNLLEFSQSYNKVLDKVRAEDLREINVLITKSTGDTLFCIMKDDNVIDYFKVD